MSNAELETFVSEWNSKHPVGCNVYVKLDNGGFICTTTRSPAWVMGGHSAMVLLTGITGGFRLDRVTIRSEAAK